MKIRRALLFLSVYIFPVFVFILHLAKYTSFVKEYWIIYIIGFALLVYSHVRYIKMRNDSPSDHADSIRRFYFNYVLFLLILILPKLNTYNFFCKDSGILGLSKGVSTCLLIIIFAFIIYLVIICDFHISEITIGKTKVTLLKEKYQEEVNSHIDISDNLMDKISSENKAIQNMGEYCEFVIKRVEQEGEINTLQEYQMLLEEYYKNQKENIKVSVIDEINHDVKKDYNLTSGELAELQYKINRKQVCNFKKNNIYCLFMPFCYKLENFTNILCIILYSEKPIIIEAERKIIPNVLVKFTDEFLNMVTIDNENE